MADELKTDDIAKMSFEEALAELETIVGVLEGGKGDLEEAISAYERGALLKSHCEKKLKAAQTKVEKITLTAGGEVTAERVEIE